MGWQRRKLSNLLMLYCRERTTGMNDLTLLRLIEVYEEKVRVLSDTPTVPQYRIAVDTLAMLRAHLAVLRGE